jgi:hypothetical protein
MVEQARIDPFIKGSGSILKTAALKLKQMGYIQLKLLSDQKGVFSIEYPKFFLTANGYLYHHSIVSSQKEIIHRSQVCKKDLVVYVAETDTFYIFNPQTIIDNHWENIRGYLLMYNWDIKLGRLLNT